MLRCDVDSVRLIKGCESATVVLLDQPAAEHALHQIRFAQGCSWLVSSGGRVWLAAWLCFHRSQVSRGRLPLSVDNHR